MLIQDLFVAKHPLSYPIIAINLNCIGFAFKLHIVIAYHLYKNLHLQKVYQVYIFTYFRNNVCTPDYAVSTPLYFSALQLILFLKPDPKQVNFSFSKIFLNTSTRNS